MPKKRPVFVLTAQIAAHLYFATEVAKRISLIAKNARAVTVRAGDKAAGFRAITDFIGSFAASTISSAATINEVAVQISHIASNQERNSKALVSVSTVFEHSEGIEHLQSIKLLHEKLQKEDARYNTDFKREIKKLNILLEETNKQVRAANVIASTSKVEASQSEQFQPTLLAISEDIEMAANEIKQHINNAKNTLSETLIR